MKKAQIVSFLVFLILFTGCAGNRVRVPENKITTTEKRVLTAATVGKEGNVFSPIHLTHRKLTLEEVAKFLELDIEATEAHLQATNVHGYYSLNASNYPPGLEFVLYQVDMAGKVNPVKTYSVNGNGLLISQLDDLWIELQYNFLFFSNYLLGEPVDFVLGSKDGQYFATTRIVPNPIEAKNLDGQSVSLQIDGADKRHYLVKCCGLEPGENYILITAFENEKLMHAVEADINGEVVKATGPTVPWVTGGDGSIELRGDDITSPLIARFKWGL